MLVYNNLYIYFDLDKTLWDTHDKHGNEIWAKQMIHPFKLIDKNTIEDDVFSRCILRKNVREFLKFLKKNKYKFSFISNARYFNLPDTLQPSLLLLKRFGIFNFFSKPNFLIYKNKKKKNFLKLNKKKNYILFDDNKEILSSFKKIDNMKPINSININDWKTQIKMIKDLTLI